MKLLYVTSLSGVRINGFMRSAIVAAKSLGIDFTMACNMDDADMELYNEDCNRYGIKTVHIDFDRNPLEKKNMLAKKQLFQLMEKENFDAVHCNTPIGGVLGRICAKKANIPYVIYQAHGFHFWKGAPLKNWLLYYPIELLLSHYTDMIVTIAREDYDLSKRMHAKACRYIHGVGIDLAKFVIRDEQDRNSKLRNRLGIPTDAKVLLSVGELNTNKNHSRVIQAVASLRDKTIHYVICGEGELKSEYEKLGKELGLDQRLHLVGFCSNVADYYRMADLFIFPSLREGIPASIMESIACGVPVIASDIRGITDIVCDKSCRFNPSNTQEISERINTFLSSDNNEFINNNYNVIQEYRFENVVREFVGLYQDAMEKIRQ